MSSRFPKAPERPRAIRSSAPLVVRVLRRVLLLITLAAGCERGDREVRTIPSGATADSLVRTSAIRAGPPTMGEPIVRNAYDHNAWAVSEGQRLFSQMNCAGCHSAGGGGSMGPPLTDAAWIYGADPENIFDTITKGRPRGMPSFGGRLTIDDTWKLVAYVRTLGGLSRRDTWAPRSDDLAETNPSAHERGVGGDADTARIKPEQRPPRPAR